MKVEIKGIEIKTEKDFHKAISSALNFGPYYGDNLDALWDILTTDIERPVMLIWKDSNLSKKAMGKDFDNIINILKKVSEQDIVWGLDRKFEFKLS